MKPTRFQFFQWRKDVDRDTLRADFVAGITGMVVLLPQGVVFAMIAGLPPIYGLYSAMIIPVVAAIFQSSYHLISGPTTAISLVVFSTINEFATPTTHEFVMLALGLTLLAGIIQLSLGLLRMGSLINFVSHSVIVGFTAGAAVLIATSQIKHILGIEMPRGLSFYDSWSFIAQHLSEVNITVLTVGASTLVIAVVLKKISRRIPYFLMAMICGSLVNLWLAGEAKGVAMVGELPSGLPGFRVPALSFGDIQMILPGAFAIALLGLIEAVAIARAIGLQSGQRINGNQEFVSQGISNIVGSFFSSYMGSGSFTRSGVNFQAGGQTPMAAIFAAVMLLLVLLFISPLASYLPIPALGGIILLVAYNLIDTRHIRSIVRTSKRETTVMAITFLATLLFHLEFAIYFGVFVSLVFFLQETSRPKVQELVPDDDDPKRNFAVREKVSPCPQVVVLRLEGAIFFGSVAYLSNWIADAKLQSKNLLFDLGRTHLIDSSGAEWLAQVAEDLRKRGGVLYLSGLKKQAHNVLKRSGAESKIGEANLFANKHVAIQEIYKQLDPAICETCDVRIFTECSPRTGIPA